MKWLAADCGGTRIKLGLVLENKLEADALIEARASDPLEDRLEAIAREWHALCDGGQSRISDCAGALLALPVVVSRQHSAVTATFGKYDEAKGFDFASWGMRRLGLPLVIENDARAAAIGEWTCGAGRGVRNMVMVTLGTGIGTAVICDGAPVIGRSGMAGNLGGHTVAQLGGAVCPCGVEGCLEAQIGSWAMPFHARQDPDFPRSALSREPLLDYAAVFRQAADGDALARMIRERALRGWGALLVNLIHSFDPERIIIGGGIMNGQATILPALRELVARQATQPGGAVEIVPSELGNAAALLGTSWLCRNAMESYRKI
jgi:glucokinase